MRTRTYWLLHLLMHFFVFPTWAAAGNIPGGPKIADCSKAKDPARCEARVAARAACKDKRGDLKRSCMKAFVVAPDCARSDKPATCVAEQKAAAACSDKRGKANKTCIRSQISQQAKH